MLLPTRPGWPWSQPPIRATRWPLESQLIRLGSDCGESGKTRGDTVGGGEEGGRGTGNVQETEKQRAMPPTQQRRVGHSESAAARSHALLQCGGILLERLPLTRSRSWAVLLGRPLAAALFLLVERRPAPGPALHPENGGSGGDTDDTHDNFCSVCPLSFRSCPRAGSYDSAEL